MHVVYNNILFANNCYAEYILDDSRHDMPSYITPHGFNTCCSMNFTRKSNYLWILYSSIASMSRPPFSMMTSKNGNIFRVTGPLCGEFTCQRWIHLMFSLICARTNGWVNNRDTGYLRRHRTHYDFNVMQLRQLNRQNMSEFSDNQQR